VEIVTGPLSSAGALVVPARIIACSNGVMINQSQVRKSNKVKLAQDTAIFT
jgi:hypothetical protein